MAESQSPFFRIYFGIPRFAGALFRATKVPSIILLIGLLGVPLATSIYLTVYTVKKHSTLPIDLFAVGFVQFKIEGDSSAAAKLPPNLDRLFRTMTPEQKKRGKQIFEYFTMFYFALSVTMFWWIASALRFAVNKAKHKIP